MAESPMFFGGARLRYMYILNEFAVGVRGMVSVSEVEATVRCYA